MQGPDYKYAHLLDKSIYARYQYVKIWAEESDISEGSLIVQPKEIQEPEISGEESLALLMNLAPVSIKKQSTIPEYVAWSETAGDTKNIYAVQVGAFIKPVPLSYFKNIKNPKSFLGRDSITRYVVSQMFNDKTLAEFLRDEIKENPAYDDAFIVELDQDQVLITPDTTRKTEPPLTMDEVIYTVQIGAYKEKVPVNLTLMYLKIEGIKSETTQEGLVVLTAGSFKNYEDATKKRNLLIREGIDDAYIVAYRNGERIPIEKAKEYSKEK